MGLDCQTSIILSSFNVHNFNLFQAVGNGFRIHDDYGNSFPINSSCYAGLAVQACNPGKGEEGAQLNTNPYKDSPEFKDVCVGVDGGRIVRGALHF